MNAKEMKEKLDTQNRSQISYKLQKKTFDLPQSDAFIEVIDTALIKVCFQTKRDQIEYS